ncbi:MAG: FG-GAP-like repeat-containing protein [Deltaproteobacteria bacterium]|nr:FG-GAP-like repeat-containing protein [Deltaproteobacteria bacterium]
MTLHDSICLRSLWVASSMMGTGCYSGLDDVDVAHSRSAEIIDNLLEVGYPAESIELRDDGQVMVDGDALVSLEASREMVGHGLNGEDSFRQYRTTNLVGANIATICVGGATFAGAVGTALDEAIARYNAQNLTFDMVRINENAPAAGCDATIVGSLVPGTGGSAGFPAGGLPFQTFQIGTGILPQFGAAVVTHVIMHELGHCIGFRHSDFFDRSISCGAGGNEGPGGSGAVHVPGTPTGAVLNGSVMNACYNANSTGQWTGSDVTALQGLYGALAGPWCTGGESGAGDFDGDGADDLYCHYANGNNFVIFSQGDGSFGPGANWSGGWCVGGEFGVGDFDGDGRDDHYCHYDSGSNFVIFSQGNGTFSGGGNWSNGWCVGGEFGVGDFNGDGRDDHWCHYDSGNNFVIFSQGNGTFAGGANWSTGWCTGGEFGTGDFNGDGRDDHWCHYDSGNNFVIFSQGNGSFSGGANWANGWCVNGEFGVGDFSGDGRDDHWCHYSNGNNFVIFSQGNGAFSGGGNWAAGWCVNGEFGVGDFSGDGRDDHSCHYADGTNFTIFSQGNGTFSGGGQWSQG